MTSPGCYICSDKPAPYRHPNDPKKAMCAECRGLMQDAEDQAARNARGDHRLGDLGERRAMREGRMTRGGRGS